MRRTGASRAREYQRSKLKWKITHEFFIVALKLEGISMCTVTNKFRRNVLEKAFIQEI